MTPPRLARRILARVVSAALRESFLDDLDETLSRIAAERGEQHARRWYWRQAAGGVTHRVLRRRSGAGADRRGAWSSRCVRALAQGWRRLTAARGFTASIVATLTCAFAAWAAVFVLVSGVLLRPLPYPDADRLVEVGFRTPGLGAMKAGQSQGGWFLERSESKSFDAIGIYNMNTVNLTETGLDPEQVHISMTSPEVFDALAVPALIGRRIENDPPGGPVEVVLSYGLWARRYGGDPGIVGKTVDVNGRARLVRGVMPRGFAFPTQATEIWMRDGFDPNEHRFGEMTYGSVARLRAGVSIAQAEAELNTLVQRLPGIYSDVRPSWLAASRLSARIEPLKAATVGSSSASLWLMLAAASLVLLLAGANVANLCVIRAEHRRHDVAVCRALGASSGTLFLTFLAESAIASAAAAVLAWVAAAALVRWLVHDAGGLLPRVETIRMDASSAVALVLVAAVTAVALAIAGFLTARGASLYQSSRGASASRAEGRARRALTAVQLALAFALISAAALLTRSFSNLVNVDLGFDPGNVLSFQISLPYTGYETFAKSADFDHQLVARLRALPGVESAGAAFSVPLSHSPLNSFLESRVLVDPGGPSPIEAPNVNWRLATAAYFETMRIPVRLGHWFAAGDHFDESFPLVVSDSFARHYLGNAPLGRRVRHYADPHTWTVVGVVGDVLDDGLREGRAESVYVPVLDQDKPAPFTAGNMAFVVRSPRAAERVADIRRALHDIDPKLPLTDVQTMDTIVRAARARDRLVMALVTAFASLAGLVGLVGLHGSLTYAIAQRRRELGIRLALGATTGTLRRVLAADAGRMIAAGVAAGFVMAWLLTRSLQSLLFNVGAGDPLIWTVSLAGFLVVASLGTLASLRRLRSIRAVEAAWAV